MTKFSQKSIDLLWAAFGIIVISLLLICLNSCTCYECAIVNNRATVYAVIPDHGDTCDYVVRSTWNNVDYYTTVIAGCSSMRVGDSVNVNVVLIRQ